MSIDAEIITSAMFIHPALEKYCYGSPDFHAMPTTNGAIGISLGSWVYVTPIPSPFFPSPDEKQRLSIAWAEA